MIIQTLLIALAGAQAATVNVPLSICPAADVLRKVFEPDTTFVTDPGVRLDRQVLVRFSHTPASAVKAALEKALDVKFEQDGQTVKVRADATARQVETACRRHIVDDLALQLKQREAAWNDVLQRGKDAYKSEAEGSVQEQRLYAASLIAEPRNRLAADLALRMMRKPKFLDSLFAAGRVVGAYSPRDLPALAADAYRAGCPSDPDMAEAGPVTISCSMAVRSNWIALRIRVSWHRTSNTALYVADDLVGLYPSVALGATTNPPLSSSLVEGYGGTPIWGDAKTPPAEFADFVKATDAASKRFAERDDAKVQFFPLFKRGYDALSQVVETWAGGNKADLVMPLDPVFEGIPALTRNLPGSNPKFSDLFGGKQSWWASDVDGVAVLKNRLSFVNAQRRFPTAAMVAAAKALATGEPFEERTEEDTPFVTLPESVWSAFVANVGTDDLGLLIAGQMEAYRGVLLHDLARGAGSYSVWMKMNAAQRSQVMNLAPKEGCSIPLSDVAGLSVGRIVALMKGSDEDLTPNLAGFDRFLAGRAVLGSVRKVKAGSLVSINFLPGRDAGIYTFGGNFHCEFYVKSTK